MLSRNIACRGGTTVTRRGVMAALTLLVAITTQPITAQSTAQSTTTATDAAPDVTRPNIEHVRAAHTSARQWLNAFETPAMIDAASNVTIDGASAVCVIVRRHGRAMGVGVDSTGDALMLRRAVGRALNDALGDPSLQALSTDLKRGENSPDAEDDREAKGDHHSGAPSATRPSPPATAPVGPRVDPDAEARIARLRADVGRSLTLELEVAGAMTPLVGRTLAQMADRIDPGRNGVAVRRDDRWTLLFPAQQRITNTLAEPERTLTSAALTAGIGMSELAAIGEQPDVSFYRFATVDLAQTSPTSEPIALERGEVVIALEQVTRENLAAAADALVAHVLTHLWPAPPAPLAGEQPLPALPMGMRGDYSPAAEQYQPPIAPPMEQALCAWALLRYAQCEAVDRGRASKAAAAAHSILRDLASVHQRELDPRDDPGACAALVHLACDSPSMVHDPVIGEMMTAAAQRVFQCFDESAGFRWSTRTEAGGSVGQPLSPVARAMLAAAIARARNANVDGFTPPAAQTIAKAVESAWSSASDNNRIALLPWIGWALHDAAQATGEPIGHIDDLRRIVQALARAQVGAGPGPTEAPDLAGGYALVGEGATQSMPNAQGLRPAAWLATASHDTRLVPADQQPLAWQQHRQSVRFLMQLAMDEVQAAMYRDAARARGGICASPLDSRQPLAAQAMGLLVLVDTLRSWPAAGLE